MPGITVIKALGSSSDLIEGMWNIIRWARAQPDEPQLWKLNDEYLDAVARFFQIEETTRLLTLTFLDVSLDATTAAPTLVCARGAYPLELFIL